MYAVSKEVKNALLETSNVKREAIANIKILFLNMMNELLEYCFNDVIEKINKRLNIVSKLAMLEDFYTEKVEPVYNLVIENYSDGDIDINLFNYRIFNKYSSNHKSSAITIINNILTDKLGVNNRLLLHMIQ